MYTCLLVHLVITLHCVSSSGPTVHCHYVTVVMCFMFTVCYSNTGSQEVINAIEVCMQYQASSTAVHCVVGDGSHLEWMKPLGDCLIRLGPKVRIHLLHTHGYSIFSCRYFKTLFMYFIVLHLQFTSGVYCLISCLGSELRGYVCSEHAMKHLPGLLTLAMDSGIQTMSLAMEHKDLLDMSVLSGFNSSTIR